ncbi:MAG: tetratricopeptide repeat protein [Pirellulaceae bacterium]|jgi:tetratricopeptide (TPR) repeat protein|nr:tetratricopeptide repeat protein [Pirellulaceae bacterium]
MKRCSALLIAAVVLSTAPALAQEDTIIGRGGTPIRGTIVGISPTSVKIETTGVARDIETREIQKLSFGDEPADVRDARDQALAGQFENALASLKKVNVAEIQNEVIKQEVGYYLAFCNAKLALTAGGDKAAAIAALKLFIGQNRTTVHFFEGVQLLGDLSFADGKYAEAGTFYGLLGKAEWPEYKMRAAVQQARAQTAEGKYPEALTAYDQILASGLNTPEAAVQKMHATVGRAVCLAATGKHDEGIAIIEDLIAKNDPSDASLFGRAYNALGACYAKAGKPQDALMAYLHTDVLFFKDSESHAEALYHLSKLWAAVNKSDRAVEARSTLQSRYPGSRWAAMN